MLGGVKLAQDQQEKHENDLALLAVKTTTTPEPTTSTLPPTTPSTTPSTTTTEPTPAYKEPGKVSVHSGCKNIFIVC